MQIGAARSPVSVVVPCYCCSATIDRALRSVRAQTALPEELIAIDDASTDDTLERLRRFERDAPGFPVRIIALGRNAGPADARNAGWDAARAQYVAFLDADDVWHPRKLELQLRFMREHPEFSISGHRHAFDGEFGALPETLPFREIRLGHLLLSNRLITPSAMLERALAVRFRPGQRHMEDHLLWLQAASAGIRIARIELELATLFKPIFGASGQSAALWPMEKAELGNYALLRREGTIGTPRFVTLAAWSLAKFTRRLLVVALRRGAGG